MKLVFGAFLSLRPFASFAVNLFGPTAERSPLPYIIVGSAKDLIAQECCLAFDDLRQWIAALDRAGELKKNKTEVDPSLEITELADRASKGASKQHGRPGGPA